MLPLDGEGSAGADEICSESSQAGAGQGLVSCWLLVHPGHNSLTQGTSSTNFPLSLHEGALRTWAQCLPVFRRRDLMAGKVRRIPYILPEKGLI